jgi:hypothetical protein
MKLPTIKISLILCIALITFFSGISFLIGFSLRDPISQLSKDEITSIFNCKRGYREVCDYFVETKDPYKLLNFLATRIKKISEELKTENELLLKEKTKNGNN